MAEITSSPDLPTMSVTENKTEGSSTNKQSQPTYIEPYGLEGIEDVEEYKPGGLHPVEMFDILDSRFEVYHKLGSGGIATAWLCYEEKVKRWTVWYIIFDDRRGQSINVNLPNIGYKTLILTVSPYINAYNSLSIRTLGMVTLVNTWQVVNIHALKRTGDVNTRCMINT